MYYRVLNQKLKKNISKGNFTFSELTAIKEWLADEVAQKKKRLLAITKFVNVVIIILLALKLFIQPTIATITLFVSALIIANVVMMPLVWFLAISLVRTQYNRAVKKGYPKHIDTFRV